MLDQPKRITKQQIVKISLSSIAGTGAFVDVLPDRNFQYGLQKAVVN